MAKPYSQLKVNELKDILRQRGLSLNGTKSELIARLTESDAKEPEAESVAEPVAENSTSTTTSEPAPASNETEATKSETIKTESSKQDASVNEPEVKSGADSVEETSESKPAETSEEAEEHTVSVQLSDDELLKQLTDDLEKQIKRIERFGGDATPLQDRLRRINRFGIAAVRDAAVKSANPREKKRMRRPKDIKKSAPKKASA